MATSKQVTRKGTLPPPSWGCMLSEVSNTNSQISNPSVLSPSCFRKYQLQSKVELPRQSFLGPKGHLIGWFPLSAMIELTETRRTETQVEARNKIKDNSPPAPSLLTSHLQGRPASRPSGMSGPYDCSASPTNCNSDLFVAVSPPGCLEEMCSIWQVCGWILRI